MTLTLAELEQLCLEATPAPWQRERNGGVFIGVDVAESKPTCSTSH